MNSTIKKDFRLVPATGVASGKGYRAEWVRGANDTLDFDAVVAETQKRGAFAQMDPHVLRSNLETFLDTLIDNVLTDAKTRKLDGYLELTLRIHGTFADKTEDFDATKHTLDLVLTPLSAFRKKPTALQPVNADRVKLFRLSYITAADELHKNHQIAYGQPFVIRGTNLKANESDLENGVFCQVQMPNGTYHTADAPILSCTDTEIRCGWPTEFGTDTVRRTLWATVSKMHLSPEESEYTDRKTYADILPA